MEAPPPEPPMKPTVLLDYQFAVAQSGYVVRTLLKLEGRAPSADGPSR